MAYDGIDRETWLNDDRPEALFDCIGLVPSPVDAGVPAAVRRRTACLLAVAHLAAGEAGMLQAMDQLEAAATSVWSSRLRVNPYPAHTFDFADIADMYSPLRTRLLDTHHRVSPHDSGVRVVDLAVIVANRLQEAAGYDHVAVDTAHRELTRSGFFRREPQTELLLQVVRDVYGDPFAPVRLPDCLQTDVVREMTRDIRDRRAWRELPVLGDLVEDILADAGGNDGPDADYLPRHLRGERPVAVPCGLCAATYGRRPRFDPPTIAGAINGTMRLRPDCRCTSLSLLWKPAILGCLVACDYVLSLLAGDAPPVDATRNPCVELELPLS